MYYLEAWFNRKNLPAIGKAMGIFYAVAMVIGCFGIGNMFQANQAYMQVLVITGGETSWLAAKGWLFGLILAGIVALVVIGGIRSIARVTSVLVPFMALLYIGAALVVIILSAEHIPAALVSVVSGAFNPDAAAGGALGAAVIGFQRALFSNEAGLGSASIAHSAVQTEEPASEGITALLEPFIDTIIILSLSSLVILTSAIPNNLMDGGLAGIELTSAAFEIHFSAAPFVIAVAALLFAFSTLLAWSYYGLKAWTYLVGEGRARELVFQTCFCSAIVIGCMVQLSAVLDFSDAMIFVIAIPNLIALYLYAPEVKRDVNDYINRLKSTG